MIMSVRYYQTFKIPEVKKKEIIIIQKKKTNSRQ